MRREMLLAAVALSSCGIPSKQSDRELERPRLQGDPFFMICAKTHEKALKAARRKCGLAQIVLDGHLFRMCTPHNDLYQAQHRFLHSLVAFNIEQCGEEEKCLLAIAELREATLQGIRNSNGCETDIALIESSEEKVVRLCSNRLPTVESEDKDVKTLARWHSKALEERTRVRERCRRVQNR